MPSSATRFRFKRLKNGKAVRIGFKGGKSVEVTPFKKNKKGVLKKSGRTRKT